MSERVYECGCGARLRYKPEWAGRSGACKKCGARFTLPREALGAEPDPGAAAEIGVAPAEIKPPRISFENAGGAAAPAPPVKDAPAGGFWADAFRGLAFMRDPGTALNILAMCVMVTALMVVSPFLLCFGIFIIIGLYGYIAGYGFRLIVHAASDEDEFPSPFEYGGFIDGVAVPLAKVVMVSVALAIPGLAVGLLTREPAAQLGATAIAYFLWPVVMLMAAVGGAFTALRLDLAARTIASSFLPYLAIWLMLLVGIGGMALAGAAGLGGVASASLGSLHPWLVLFLTNLIGISMLVVTMWTIGLYYRHFKDRFPWSAG